MISVLHKISFLKALSLLEKISRQKITKVKVKVKIKELPKVLRDNIFF